LLLLRYGSSSEVDRRKVRNSSVGDGHRAESPGPATPPALVSGPLPAPLSTPSPVPHAVLLDASVVGAVDQGGHAFLHFPYDGAHVEGRPFAVAQENPAVGGRRAYVTGAVAVHAGGDHTRRLPSHQARACPRCDDPGNPGPLMNAPGCWDRRSSGPGQAREQERARGRSRPPSPVVPPMWHAGTLEEPGQFHAPRPAFGPPHTELCGPDLNRHFDVRAWVRSIRRSAANAESGAIV